MRIAWRFDDADMIGGRFGVARKANGTYSAVMHGLVRKLTGLIVLIPMGLAAAPAMALETSLQFVLTLSGDIERKQVRYQCEGRDELLQVEYVNAPPNFLAILSVDEGEPLVFASVISGSGVRYAAGIHEWWSKGPEASLYDLLADDPDTPVLTCLEFNDIP